MITTSVRLSHFEKSELLNLECAVVQTGQIFDRFFGGDNLISKYSQCNF